MRKQLVLATEFIGFVILTVVFSVISCVIPFLGPAAMAVLMPLALYELGKQAGRPPLKVALLAYVPFMLTTSIINGWIAVKWLGEASSSAMLVWAVSVTWIFWGVYFDYDRVRAPNTRVTRVRRPA